MNALKNNLEKIVFVVVLIGCVIFAIGQIPESDNVIKTTGDQLDVIERTLKAKQVSTNYEFHQSKQDEKLIFREQYLGNVQRPAKAIRSDIAGWVAYPQPERPQGELKLPVPVQEFFAEFMPITDFRVTADQGRVVIAFKKPEGFKHMELVRVEVLRGKSPDKLEKFETITFGPEEGPATEAPKTTAAPTTPTAPAEATGRRPRSGTTPAAGRNTKPVEKNPFEGMTVVIDTSVEQKVKYYYKAVPVARMTKMPDVQDVKKNPAGEPEKIEIYRAPKDVTPVPPSRPDAKTALFKSAGTEVKEVVPPSNFQIRLAGTIGTFSPPETPEARRSKDYKGNFEVKVWVPEAQSFKEITMQAAPGENLKGQLSYKTADGKDTKQVDFDTGYQLVEIKWGTKGGEETLPDGTKKSQPIIPNEVAVLLELKTKKTEDFPKRPEFEHKSDNLKYYEALDKERREQEKVNQERLRAAAERVKAFDEANKKPTQ